MNSNTMAGSISAVSPYGKLEAVPEQKILDKQLTGYAFILANMGELARRVEAVADRLNGAQGEQTGKNEGKAPHPTAIIARHNVMIEDMEHAMSFLTSQVARLESL